jgi:ATP-dependent Clp protease ATP-binding subunit ClpC
MFERFTDRARRAIVMAQEEARLLDHNHIGTEHILLGLLAEREGVAARALESLNVTLEAARDQVREIIGPSHHRQEQAGHIPFTPRAKKVLELSLREALNLRSDTIGTEHVLLGLIAEGDGVGAQILERLGAHARTVREKVVQLAGTGPGPIQGGDPGEGWVVSGPPRASRIRIESLVLVEFRDLLRSIDRRLAAIERHLGIATDEEPAEPSAPGTEPPGEAPPPPTVLAPCPRPARLSCVFSGE